MNNLKVRQGAIVLHIDCYAKVIAYEVSLNVPMDFNSNIAKVYNKRKRISQEFPTWEAAMHFKLNYQACILEWKIKKLQERRTYKALELTNLELTNLL